MIWLLAVIGLAAVCGVLVAVLVVGWRALRDAFRDI